MQSPMVRKSTDDRALFEEQEDSYHDSIRTVWQVSKLAIFIGSEERDISSLLVLLRFKWVC